MATKPKPVVEKPSKEDESRFLKITRDILLAGIGAVALSQDKIEEFINRLIERGEIAEKDGKKLVREVVDKRKKGAKKAEDEVNKRIEEILDHMNVPTKADIDALSVKVSDLSTKVDELKKPA
jgi:poly(hydroxyalkanoate) granule-associated protein